ncbi:MAG: hypothetical protein EOP11_26735 [Proteobacteria bacterium]|nr:MAG: hypothetical protein EOP11_26735 [Pseudomonadota bacterium]
MMDKNHALRVANQHRLRELKQNQPRAVEIFCAHDVKEFERLAGRPAGHAPHSHSGLKRTG